MKRNIIYLTAVLLLSVAAASCSKDSLDPESVITVDKVQENDFDKWLAVNYLTPYNIEFKYRYEMNESDMNYYTVPADYECSVMMAHLVKYLCIESYDEVAGVDFTRRYFPKMFFMSGEFEYRNNGTMILGTAEGGKKIMLSGLNYLKKVVDDAEALNYYYIKTIHHEFTHILNQTVDYSTDFGQITGSGYVADSWSSEPYDTSYLRHGFITAYSQYSNTEDFAEMLSCYITHTQAWWNTQLASAGTSGAAFLTSKLDIVRSYMNESFNIDIDKLREVIQRRQADVVQGKVDLTDLSIK